MGRTTQSVRTEKYIFYNCDNIAESRKVYFSMNYTYFSNAFCYLNCLS
jgi:hypothetical protein